MITTAALAIIACERAWGVAASANIDRNASGLAKTRQINAPATIVITSNGPTPTVARECRDMNAKKLPNTSRVLLGRAR